MTIIATLLVVLVILEHCYFLYLEMFLWTKPLGMKTFGLTAEQAENTKALAANQGLYNGFLAAGLIWGLVHPDATTGWQIQLFFLCCVLVAGIFGGLTAKRSILAIQGLPALLAILALLFI
ncbi:MAG: DUF1304 domain-containing protein [Arenicella sp.]